MNNHGWGFRVPGIVISAWAKSDYVDHDGLIFDNLNNRFIEDRETRFGRGALKSLAGEGWLVRAAWSLAGPVPEPAKRP